MGISYSYTAVDFSQILQWAARVKANPEDEWWDEMEGANHGEFFSHKTFGLIHTFFSNYQGSAAFEIRAALAGTSTRHSGPDDIVYLDPEEVKRAAVAVRSFPTEALRQGLWTETFGWFPRSAEGKAHRVERFNSDWEEYDQFAAFYEQAAAHGHAVVIQVG